MEGSASNLLPNIVARRCGEEHPYACISSPSDTVNITFSDLDRASNVAAWILHDVLEHDEHKFFYIGRSDIRHLVWVIGAAKAGKCVVFPSPSNTIEANLRLFETVAAQKLLYAPESISSLTRLIEAGRNCGITSFPAPAYSEILTPRSATPYPFSKSWEEVKDEAVMGLHTSGTSGHPKPLYWSHAGIHTLASHADPATVNQAQPTLLGEVQVGQVLFLPFPLFHMGGIGPSLGAFFYGGTKMVFPAPDVHPSPENLHKILRRTKATAACMPPSFIENALNYAPAIQSLAQLKSVAYLGGPMNPIHGEKLARMVPGLCSMFGTTEGGAAHLVYPGNSSYWNAMKFVDLGQSMEEVSPGIYELVFPRTAMTHRTTGFFHSQPQLAAEYRTKDMFSPVKNQDGWWTYRGRADNWIAMSNGLKMDPTQMENTIGACPEVKGVVVAGEGYFRLCLLVELHEQIAVEDNTVQHIMQSIWSSIEKANSASPKFGKIPRELVFFANKAKPFLRTSKGTIQRGLTVQAYEDEIEDMYAKAEEGLLTQDLPAVVSREPRHLVDFLKYLYSDLLDVERIGEHDDLLALGMDSLAAQMAVARLKAVLRKYGADEGRIKKVDIRMVYTATTLSQMAEKLIGVLSVNQEMEGAGIDSGFEDSISLLRHYEETILQLPKSSAGTGNSIWKGPKVVVLTGSTGTIGSYILSWLLSRSDVETVICLNRSADAERKQMMSFRSKGLTTLPEGKDRVRFMRTELSDVRLGLSDEDYELVRQQATHFIHNAFPVNFLLTIRSFEPHMAALTHLVQLARNGNMSPAFMFISSIAAATRVSGDMKTIEEMVLSVDQARNLLPQGYAQAKFVCEHLLGTYAAHTGKRASILRVGQVCGPLSGTGTWDMSEWFPSLVISSKMLGVAPDSIGPPVNWVPVDVLGEIVSELLDSSQESFTRDVLVYNVVNPRPTPWNQLLGALEGVVPVATNPAEWLSRLEESIDGRLHHPNQVVGVKLIDFYKAMLGQSQATKIDMDHLVSHSQRAATLGPIKKRDIVRWMRAWNV